MKVYHVTVREAAKDGWIVKRGLVEAKSHGHALERTMRLVGYYTSFVTSVRFAYNTNDPEHAYRIRY